jgi:hypothetical protein
MSSCPGCEYSDILCELREEFPQFKIVWKEDSWLMKFIAGFLFFITLGRQRTFQTDYITTIGCVVYVPECWRDNSDIVRTIVLRHERVHMRQKRFFTMPIFTFLYLFFPLPGGLAYFRAVFEMEAYEETIRATVELLPNGADLVRRPEAKQQMVDNFVGPSYFWMWPFRKRMEAWYDAAVDRALVNLPAE